MKFCLFFIYFFQASSAVAKSKPIPFTFFPEFKSFYNTWRSFLETPESTDLLPSFSFSFLLILFYLFFIFHFYISINMRMTKNQFSFKELITSAISKAFFFDPIFA